jgi:hypothetical protein
MAGTESHRCGDDGFVAGRAVMKSRQSLRRTPVANERHCGDRIKTNASARLLQGLSNAARNCLGPSQIFV